MDLYDTKKALEKFIERFKNIASLMLLILTVVFVWVFLPKSIEATPLYSYQNPWSIEFFMEATDPPEIVKQGYLLISTQSNLWPSKPQTTSNSLACTNCHLNAGTQNGAASFMGVTNRYPKFSGRDGKISDLADRINGCMERSMNGVILEKKGPQMKAFLAYMSWLDNNYITLQNHKVGFIPIKTPKRAVNQKKGREVYIQECALCHGKKGEGTIVEGQYQYPPLWGSEAYNNGAGMNRVLTAAAFIKSNMPYLEASWQQPKLTDLEAFDVAGYINSQNRPRLAKTAQDYPDKKLKPVSTPYSPWEDSFSAQQHKYGPYDAIQKYYAERHSLKKKY